MGDMTYYKIMFTTVALVLLFLVVTPYFALKVPLALFSIIAGFCFYYYVTLPLPVRAKSKRTRR